MKIKLEFQVELQKLPANFYDVDNLKLVQKTEESIMEISNVC